MLYKNYMKDGVYTIQNWWLTLKLHKANNIVDTIMNLYNHL